MDFEISSGNPFEVVPKRREARLPASLNVRVLGIDANGKPFHQPATTLDISLSGARITGVAARLNQGDIVGLQSGGGKSRFKVSWVRANRDGSYRLGLHCLEKGRCPWRENIQQNKAGDRRSDERFPCNGSVSLRSGGSTAPIHGSIRDVSELGCYVQCFTVAPESSILSGQFTINGVEINGVAEVRNSVPAEGMGLLWCDLGCDGQEKLNGILRRIAMDTSDAHSRKAKALSQVNKLHQLITTLRDQMENDQTVVRPETILQLSEAQERLSAALRRMQS